ncbi:hypothetical protein MRB53_015719 [Persea americana]|uniref:Uncharacterized protein n=1 Tax=Persea americana TaxID=3435 RepID=A0ACC2M044_PERAE|nr:hypothetical protein MRB53_015719 [Persea americana]
MVEHDGTTRRWEDSQGLQGRLDDLLRFCFSSSSVSIGRAVIAMQLMQRWLVPVLEPLIRRVTSSSIPMRRKDCSAMLSNRDELFTVSADLRNKAQVVIEDAIATLKGNEEE